MSKEQIEEMARDICECFNNDGTCYQDDKPCDCKCDSFTDAQYLYEKGYRKQSEVAREIFEEIYKLLFSSFTAVMPCNSRLVSLNELAELKKKYTGEK